MSGVLHSAPMQEIVRSLKEPAEKAAREREIARVDEERKRAEEERARSVPSAAESRTQVLGVASLRGGLSSRLGLTSLLGVG